MSTARRIVFVERDGALLRPPEAAGAAETLRLATEVLPSLLRLRDAGFELVLTTWQPGLGGPERPAAAFERLQASLLELLGSQGIRFAEVLVCPHPASADCTCRKPHLGLVRPLLAGGLDLERSAVVGADDLDLAFARNLGVRGLRVGVAADPGDPSDWPGIARTLVGAARRARRRRATAETSIEVEVDLDAPGPLRVSTGIAFFDHMLEQLGKHGGFALTLAAQGDLAVEAHHTVEDVALTVGEALRAALGDKHGIGRYGFVLPMDETEAQVSLDLSGRPYFVFEGSFSRSEVGGLPTEMVPHFFRSLSDALGATLHLRVRGDNAHHMVESCFKVVGRALRAAVRRDETGGVPSTKGSL